MICFLNQKLLSTESDMIQVGLIKDKLQQAKVPYAINPMQKGSRFGQARDSHMAAGVGMRFSQFSDISYVHKIYVKRKDYLSACAAVGRLCKE